MIALLPSKYTSGQRPGLRYVLTGVSPSGTLKRALVSAHNYYVPQGVDPAGSSDDWACVRPNSRSMYTPLAPLYSEKQGSGSVVASVGDHCSPRQAFCVSSLIS